MRKLVTLQRIENVFPIEGADKIEVVKFKDISWQCVVAKGKFKPGDEAIYFEIDSFLPIEPEFEFLRKCCFKKMEGREGFRLKTVKLRGAISQGLAMPRGELERFLPETIEPNEDLSSYIGVEKYEAPVPVNLLGEVVGGFPSFIEKTNQERVQNVYKELKELGHLDKPYTVTLKMDGTSMTVFAVDKDKFGSKESYGVCGRNYEFKKVKGNSYWDVAEKQKLVEFVTNFLEKTGRSIALQGELVGPRIQKNIHGLKEHTFFLFDIFDIDKGRRLLSSEVDEILEGSDILRVPKLDTLVPNEVFSNIEEMLVYADGVTEIGKSREGVVFECEELVDGRQLSFKVISNNYLLKGGE